MPSTSMPRWSRTPPQAPHDGIAYAVVTVGATGQLVGRAWMAELAEEPVVCLHAAVLGDIGAQFQQLLQDIVVGWRLLISAPEANLAQLRAAAIAAGMIDAEITEHVSDQDQRRVRCVHCAHISVTTAPVGASTQCPGCGASLFIYHHFSRRLACYLGFQSDAESLGAAP